MKKSNRLALAILLGAALSACAGSSRFSQDLLAPDPRLTCSAERGMGGTGISSTERGMGGTGLMAAGDERGMGGTGIGAGVIGTVTGFGSICVSGVRITYDEATPISADKVPMNLDALELGSTVAAVVTTQGGELRASRIEILHALIGPVTSVSPFAVMGAPVETANAAGESAASFAVGDVAVVDGLQRPDGTVSATRLVRGTSELSASVRGAVSSMGGSIRVGGVPLAPTPGALQPGAWVAATGIWVNDSFRLSSLSAVAELDLPTNARLSLEGYLLPRPGGGFGIRGIQVRENLARQLSRGDIARLAAGQRVQIVGVSDVDGAVQPYTIIVPDFSSPLRSPLQRAAEAAASDAAADTSATTTQTREALQLERGVYGTTVTRPEAVRSLTPVAPETIRTRPLPTRPSAPTRPEAVPQRPNRGG